MGEQRKTPENRPDLAEALARERRRAERLRDALAYIAANQNRMSSVDAGRIAANALASDVPGQEGEGQ